MYEVHLRRLEISRYIKYDHIDYFRWHRQILILANIRCSVIHHVVMAHS